MQDFKSPESAQRFLVIRSVIDNLFNTRRHIISRKTNRQIRDGGHPGVDIPVHKVIGRPHFVADPTLPYGRRHAR